MTATAPTVEVSVPASGTGTALCTIRLTRGTVTPEELAALVTALLAVRQTTAISVPRRGSEWAARNRLLNVSPRPGPGAWYASVLPS
ncbi:acyl-CoA carboxylase epsilon subunit [Streptomyces fulvoviolaceus]|uniref:acyl-CoA carboxylase epsilon subunit n=1 Tax=Streptomyces fulvoviolaceus TaxID=285535 RepID=UPI000996BFD8|nr:acyl-CoA carboxylase epsilon subunit [Streptomyces fulvoviolaceus]